MYRVINPNDHQQQQLRKMEIFNTRCVSVCMFVCSVYVRDLYLHICKRIQFFV